MTLRDRFQPSEIKLWGWDPAELAKYEELTRTRAEIKVFDRTWFVESFEWVGNAAQGTFLYEIILKAVVTI